MHPEEVLEGKLEAYSSSIEGNQVTGSWRRRVGHVPRYAAAIASALALTTNANADIVYSGFQNIRTALGSCAYCSAVGQMQVGGARFTEDLFVITQSAKAFGYAIVEDELAFEFGFPPPRSNGSVLLGQTRRSAGSKGGFARRLNSGQVVSTNGNFAKTAMLRINSVGQFQPSQVGFAGVRFLAADGYHYGWIRFLVTDTPRGFPGQVTALDWAYDTTAGEPVTAGEGFPDTPEPDAKPLLLLALGAVGVQVWRRKRPA